MTVSPEVRVEGVLSFLDDLLQGLLHEPVKDVQEYPDHQRPMADGHRARVLRRAKSPTPPHREALRVFRNTEWNMPHLLLATSLESPNLSDQVEVTHFKTRSNVRVT
jgi:hypothetical protein